MNNDKNKEINKEQRNKKKNCFKIVGLNPTYRSIYMLFLLILLFAIFYGLLQFSRTGSFIKTFNKIVNKIETIDFKIITTDFKFIVIPYDLIDRYSYIIQHYYNRNSDNKYAQDLSKLAFVNTVTWEYTPINANNKYKKPIGIKINDNEILFYEDGIPPEMYNHRTKTFKLLPPVDYDLGSIYYQHKSREILFINKNHITEFDIETKKFKKLSDGIPELKTSERIYKKPSYSSIINYKHLILPYSEDYIYICVFKQNYDNYIFESIIKLNLNNYEYRITNVQNSLNIKSYSIVDNDKIVLISDTDIYFYDIKNNNFEKIGIIKDFEPGKKEFHIVQYNNNKLLLIPVFSEIFFQVFDLNTKQTDIVEIVSEGISEKLPVVLIDNKVIASNGIVFDIEKQKLYYPNHTRNIIENKFKQIIIPLNNKEFLRLGCIDTNKESLSSKGSIIKLKKFNENEFYFIFGLQSSYALGKYINRKKEEK